MVGYHSNNGTRERKVICSYMISKSTYDFRFFFNVKNSYLKVSINVSEKTAIICVLSSSKTVRKIRFRQKRDFLGLLLSNDCSISKTVKV